MYQAFVVLGLISNIPIEFQFVTLRGHNFWRFDVAKFLQKYPELAGILSQKEIDDLEGDIDPITMCSDKLSAFVYQSANGPAEVSPAIFSAVDADIKGLNVDYTACSRILGKPHSLSLLRFQIPERFYRLFKIELLHTNNIFGLPWVTALKSALHLRRV